MRYPFGSPESRILNKQIFETLYYGALEASCELAEKHGTYLSYPGSPISQGVCILDYTNECILARYFFSPSEYGRLNVCSRFKLSWARNMLNYI